MVKYLINEKEQKTFQHARIFFETCDIQLDTSCSELHERGHVWISIKQFEGIDLLWFLWWAIEKLSYGPLIALSQLSAMKKNLKPHK